MNTEPASIDELANQLCRIFPRSPFAFFSERDNPTQRVVAVLHGRLKIGVVHFPADETPDARVTLIRALRAKRRVVYDADYVRSMPPYEKAVYSQNKKFKKLAISMGLEVPNALKEAFIAEIAADDGAINKRR